MESDEELHRQMRQGSTLAFEALYSRYESPLFGFIMRRVGNRQSAEEIFHETMLTAFKEPFVDTAGGAFRAWVYKVALHKSLNTLRNEARRRKHDLALAKNADVEAHQEGSSEDERSKLQDLERAAKNLSPALFSVFELRRAGKKYNEMSKELGLPVGTVKSRVHLMVAQLRKELQRWIVK